MIERTSFFRKKYEILKATGDLRDWRTESNSDGRAENSPSFHPRRCNEHDNRSCPFGTMYGEHVAQYDLVFAQLDDAKGRVPVELVKHVRANSLTMPRDLYLLSLSNTKGYFEVFARKGMKLESLLYEQVNRVHKAHASLANHKKVPHVEAGASRYI